MNIKSSKHQEGHMDSTEIKKENETDITPEKDQAKKTIKIFFVIRIVLWVVAFGATAYWIYYSFHLYSIGIHLPEEYSPLLRPVLYKGLLIAVVSLVIAALLHIHTAKLKKKFWL